MPRSNKHAFRAWERELFDAASRFDAKAARQYRLKE